MGTASFANPVHATRHSSAGDDPVTPDSIGAATAAQGAKADTAVQPGSLATVATTGAYTDLSGKPTLYTDENAQDAIAAAFAAGTQTGITVTYNDAANSFSLAVTSGLAVATLVGDNSTDNSPAITAAFAALPNGGTVLFRQDPAHAGVIGVTSPVVPPEGVTMWTETSSRKVYTDKTKGMVFVPLAGFTDPVVATDSVGGSVAAPAGNGSMVYTKTTGNIDQTQFKVGQLVTFGGGTATQHANMRILQISGATMTLTAGTGAGAGTVTSLTAKWGAVVAAPNDYTTLLNVSADAGNTVPRAVVGTGFRNHYIGVHAHGGTLCSLDLPGTSASTTQQPKIHDCWAENSQNHGTAYQDYYGPYSVNLEQGDATVTGDTRWISGTKRIGRGGAGGQASDVHMTGATNGGPNLELASPFKFANLYMDSVDGIGTCLIRHRSGAGNWGFDGGHTDIVNLLVICDISISTPLLIEESTVNSVRVEKAYITTTGGPGVTQVTKFNNGSNADTQWDDVQFQSGSIVDNTALWNGGVPGRATHFHMNDGTDLDGGGAYAPAADVSITAGSDNAVVTTPLLREGTYEFDIRVLCSGSTLSANVETYINAGTATLANNSGGGAGLSNATAGNPWSLSAHGTFQVTAPGTVSLNVHPTGTITGTILAKKNTPLMSKSGATVLTLRKAA